MLIQRPVSLFCRSVSPRAPHLSFTHLLVSDLIWACLLLCVGCQPPEKRESYTFSITPASNELDGGQDSGGQIGGSDDEAGSSHVGGEAIAGEISEEARVSLTIQAINPLTQSGISGLSATIVLTDREDEAVIEDQLTDAMGQVTFSLPSQTQYQISFQAEGYPTHHLIGEVANSSARQVTFISTLRLRQQVLGALNLSSDENLGLVVIGLDLPTLAPALGASADLNSEYEAAFVLGSFAPRLGQEIAPDVGGFVSFANVVTGEAEVIVTPPENSRCAVAPAERDETKRVPVYAGEVTILIFTCRPN